MEIVAHAEPDLYDQFHVPVIEQAGLRHRVADGREAVGVSFRQHPPPPGKVGNLLDPVSQRAVRAFLATSSCVRVGQVRGIFETSPLKLPAVVQWRQP